jgi:hypothetical protein
MEIAPLPVPKSSQTPCLSFGWCCMACSVPQPLAFCDISKNGNESVFDHIANWYLCEVKLHQQDPDVMITRK